jgi:hypothetical protein
LLRLHAQLVAQTLHGCQVCLRCGFLFSIVVMPLPQWPPPGTSSACAAPASRLAPASRKSVPNDGAGEGHTASSAASRQCRLVFRKELPLQRRIRTSDTDSCWQTQGSGVLKCKETPGKQGASNGLSLRCVSSSILDGSKREMIKGGGMRRREEYSGEEGVIPSVWVFTCFCYLGG